MSDDADRRTIPPTPRRVQEFRRRGEIALSRDLVGLSAIVCGTAATMLYARDSQAALAGIAAVSCVAETKVVGRAAPFQFTVELLTKFVPLTVSVKAAPQACAEFGLRLVSVGDRIKTVVPVS